MLRIDGLVASSLALACTSSDTAAEAREARIEGQLRALGNRLDAIERNVKDLDDRVEAQANELSARRQANTNRSDEPTQSEHAGVSCDAKARTCTLARALVDKLRANPEDLTRQVRVVPHMRNGETKGFKLYAIRSASLLRALGFKNGMILRAVDGRRLDSTNSLVALAEALMRLGRDRDEMKLELEFRDERIEKTLRVEP